LTSFGVRSLRGEVEDTWHHVSIAVTQLGRTGTVESTRSFGRTDAQVLLRSAAKPFQAIPLYDRAVERFAMSTEEVALAAASHNSELGQVAIVRDLLARLGMSEKDLVCGPHRPLIKDLGYVLSDGTPDPTLAPRSRLASNCSGKHTAMLAVASAAGWRTAGYEALDHPVQQGCRRVLAQFANVPEESLGTSVDGCGVVCWSLSLASLATAFSRFVRGDNEPEREIAAAMMKHPDLVAGERRLCTALMRAYPNQVLAKVGAGGLYVAAFPHRGVGLALKVVDGNSMAAGVALLAVIEQDELLPDVRATLPDYIEPVMLNTNHVPIGRFEAIGRVVWADA